VVNFVNFDRCVGSNSDVLFSEVVCGLPDTKSCQSHPDLAQMLPTFFQETDDTASVAITIPAGLNPTVPGAAFPGLPPITPQFLLL
jgi:hypothetical protein